MSIFGLVWVASWFGCFSSIGEKLIEAPKYLSHVFSSQVPSSSNASTSRLQTLSEVRNSSLFSTVAPFSAKSSQDSRFITVSSEQPASAHAVLLGAIESFLFTHSPQQPIHSLNVSQESTFQPLAWQEVTSEQSGSPLNYLVEVVHNFFSGVPGIAAFDRELSPVVVIQAGSEPINSPHLTSRTGFWRCAARYENPSNSTATRDFQIWVKGCLVAEVPDQSDAEAIANRLKQMLKRPALDASQLHPGLERGEPAIKLNNRVVLRIDLDLAAQFDRPAELVAIEWVNNLRTALGEDPFSLAEAQMQMHNLRGTGDSISGLASWYGPYFHGRETATGETFDQNELTAAHPSLPFGTYLKVTNLLNSKSVVVRVNDRGPYFDNRILDLSSRAARCIGSEDKGVVPIEASIMHPTVSVAATSHQQEVALR